MKTIRLALLSAALAAGASSQVSAARSDVFSDGKSFYGQPAVATYPSSRVVQLSGSQPLALTIAYGETVIFKAPGGQQFAWTFNGLDRRSADLQKIAPQGFPVVAGSRVAVGPNRMTHL